MKLAALATPLLALIPFCAPPAPATYDHLPCAQWAPMALEAGWQPDDLDQLLPIMWRESRCQPDAIRRNARGAAVDVGLLQINQIHKQRLAERGFSHADMTDPAANLWFGRVLFDWHEAAGHCGWKPWRGKC